MSARARRVPTELAALVLGVQEVTVRQWARRGKITRYGTARRALYDLDELTELARSSTPRPAPGPAPGPASGDGDGNEGGTPITHASVHDN
ncbi:MerR family transcriptional regulator [Streptomyces sp. NPDC059618]|uniref:MerR family transcriptional regulator n=1 Tax=Streptomyces sp. NPDC059618 TaxID=3346887 RepID=UPI0036CFF78B